MPILVNHRDNPEKALLRAAQQDPWVMYLVVHQEVPVSGTSVLLAGAEATMRCADELSRSPRWQASFEAWADRSFRKVSLRARQNAWSKLDALDGGTALVGGRPAVRALPPRLRSECGSLLKSLQVYNPDPATLSPEDETIITARPAMSFIINPEADMSVGKALAQVSHAVLMCAWSPWAEDPRYQSAFAEWRSAGYPARFLDPSSWGKLRSSADGVVVRDAGLTEVEPGTETVMALPPSS